MQAASRRRSLDQVHHAQLSTPLSPCSDPNPWFLRFRFLIALRVSTARGSPWNQPDQVVPNYRPPLHAESSRPRSEGFPQRVPEVVHEGDPVLAVLAHHQMLLELFQGWLLQSADAVHLDNFVTRTHGVQHVFFTAFKSLSHCPSPCTSASFAGIFAPCKMKQHDIFTVVFRDHVGCNRT